MPGFAELLATFTKIGFLSFGGAAGQIAMMHTIVVDEKKWLSEKTFQRALSYCMLLPGPEAQQLATYIGWLTHGVRGGVAAGLLFVVPGAAIMLALSMMYVLASGFAVIDGIFFGIKAAVLAIVVHALLRIARRGLRTPMLMALAAVSLAAILLLDIPFPVIVLSAAVVGAVLSWVFPAAIGLGERTDEPHGSIDGSTVRAALLTALGCLIVWWAPVILAAGALGSGHFLVEIGLFFSKLAVVTFGGAYALLGYLAQAAVEAGWVRPNEMIDGLGLAETTPGPTILVNQFVAFLGGYRAADPFPPLVGAVLAALLATWVTFAPSFLWIFAGAPFMDVLSRDARVAGALSGITAAVVGVIAFLTIWFGLHVLFGTVSETTFGPLRLLTVAPDMLDWRAALLCAAAFVLMFVWHRGIMTTVGAMAAAGVTIKIAGF